MHDFIRKLTHAHGPLTPHVKVIKAEIRECVRKLWDGFKGPVEFTGGQALLLLHTFRSCAVEDADDDDDDDDEEDIGQVDRPRVSVASLFCQGPFSSALTARQQIPDCDAVSSIHMYPFYPPRIRIGNNEGI
ncbi:unnamed protein product [Lota lota]